jgi:predicted ATPase
VRYLKFIIKNYRAISTELEIDVDKKSLTPIIGVNESGKTTILHAIYAFDFNNDDMDEGTRHLRDSTNLYRTNPEDPVVSALIEVDKNYVNRALAEVEKSNKAAKEWCIALRKRSRQPNRILISRNLRTHRYSIQTAPFTNSKFAHALAGELVRYSPFILFFDDFRDKVEDKIEIDKEQEGSGWLGYMQQLFKQADPGLSVFALKDMGERQRKSAMAKVQRYLNTTLTREWANFRLDERDALEISIEYVLEPSQEYMSPVKEYLKLNVVETDARGDQHYFFISDRSKGFFWFFNFVMKLEFNPKVIEEGDRNTVYLLDEPGSYLHASAQSRLCRKLKALSANNRVLYCTHSHYLLDPEVIPLADVRIAEKDANGNVAMVSVFEHRGTIIERRSAFQPIIDALQIKPFLLDLNVDRIIVVEGICDFYAFSMFKGGRVVAILPCVGASSIKFYISLLLAWQVQFRALWDDDDEGRRAFEDARKLFGDEIATHHFRRLPKAHGRNGCILQDLFSGNDVAMAKKELQLPTNTSFDKVIAALYYSLERSRILGMVSTETRDRFDSVFTSMSL